MRSETIATITFLLLLVATGPVGAVPLSLSILVTYALIRTSVRRQTRSKGAERTGILAFGAFAVAMLAFLVGLWSLTVDLSFPVGGALWLGIIAALEHGLQLAARWNDHYQPAWTLYSVVDSTN